MINFLKDVSVDTFIGEIPSILNFNNNQVNKEFEYLFDSSNNYLKQSLYAPSGSVSSHWGRFINLNVDYLSVNNIDSLKNTLSKVPHNFFSKRFSKDLVNTDGTIDYAHDLEAIESGLNDNESLAGRLSRVDSKINELFYYLTAKNGTIVNKAIVDSSGTGFPDYIDVSSMEMMEVSLGVLADSSYQETLKKWQTGGSGGSSVVDCSMLTDIDFINNHNTTYYVNDQNQTVYDASTSTIEITNEHINFIKSKKLGQIINLIFRAVIPENFVVNISNYFSIVILYKYNRYYTTRVRLIAKDDESFEWEVYDYSYIHAGDFSLKYSGPA